MSPTVTALGLPPWEFRGTVPGYSSLVKRRPYPLTSRLLLCTGPIRRQRPDPGVHPQVPSHQSRVKSEDTPFITDLSVPVRCTCGTGWPVTCRHHNSILRVRRERERRPVRNSLLRGPRRNDGIGFRSQSHRTRGDRWFVVRPPW